MRFIDFDEHVKIAGDQFSTHIIIIIITIVSSKSDNSKILLHLPLAPDLHIRKLFFGAGFFLICSVH